MIVPQSLDLLCKDKTLFIPKLPCFMAMEADTAWNQREISAAQRAGAGSVFYCITWSKEAKEMVRGVVWNLWNCALRVWTNCSHLRQNKRDAPVNWTWLDWAPWCSAFKFPLVILAWYIAGIFISHRVSCGLSGACFAFSWRGPLGGRYILLSTWQQ